MKARNWMVAGLLAAATFAAGCNAILGLSGDTVVVIDGGVDANTDATRDSGGMGGDTGKPDAADGGGDAHVETGPDAGVDTGTEAGVDTGTDAGSMDAAAEAGACDAGTCGCSDASVARLSWVALSTTNLTGVYEHAMTYQAANADAGRAARILLGPGTYFNAGSQYNEGQTCAWSASSQSWSCWPSSVPATQYGMASDGTNVVMFGSATALPGMACWNDGDENWNYACAPAGPGCGTPSPALRTSPAMAYDPDDNLVLMAGGFASGNLADAWIWRSTGIPCLQDSNPRGTWTSTAGMPLPGSQLAIAYHQPTHLFVLYGLFGDGQYHTYTYDPSVDGGNPWTDTGASGPVPSRIAALMTYDPNLQRTVLIGGEVLGTDGGTWAGDRWEWDGHCWQQATDTGAPAATQYGAMAHDGERLVIFGGYDPADCADAAVAGFCQTTWTSLP